MAETAIEWATHVWNPVTGCSRVSPGCAHCYALSYAARLKAMGQAKYQRDGGRGSGPGFGVTLHEDELAAPLRWRKPRRVFVNSMSDLFHEEIPDEFIARVFAVMAASQRHTFQVLTKRPERMATLLTRDFHEQVCRAAWEICERHDLTLSYCFPLPNIWLGVSIENRRFVGRADLLRETPAAVRFISAEPLLGPLLHRGNRAMNDPRWPDRQLDLSGIDWLIVGGESGPGHRPMRSEWVRDLHDATRASGTAFFFKQWGGNTPKAGGRQLDGRTWDELPVARRKVVAA
jgi:protein gp37